MAGGMRADAGADGGATGAGVHPPKENSSLPLRPAWTATGADYPGQHGGVARGV